MIRDLYRLTFEISSREVTHLVVNVREHVEADDNQDAIEKAQARVTARYQNCDARLVKLERGSFVEFA